MKNYYRILQVDLEAEPEVISVAYKKLAQKYHPDQNPQTQERMKEINEAYETLKDPNKRVVYDRNLHEYESRPKGGSTSVPPKETPKRPENDSLITTLGQLERALLQTNYCGNLVAEVEDFRKAKLVSKLSDGYFVYHLAHWAGGQHLYVTSKAQTFDSIALSYYGAFFGRAEISEILNKLPKL